MKYVVHAKQQEQQVNNLLLIESFTVMAPLNTIKVLRNIPPPKGLNFISLVTIITLPKFWAITTCMIIRNGWNITYICRCSVLYPTDFVL